MNEALFTVPDAEPIPVDEVVRVAVPAMPGDRTIAGAARACWAEWEAIKSRGLYTECMHDLEAGDQHLQWEYELDLIRDVCAMPAGWDGEDWWHASVVRFEPTSDPGTMFAVVRITP